MTRTFQSRPSVSLPAPRARFATALAASAVAHTLLLSTLLTDLPWRALAPGPAVAPITVRLASAPDPAPDSPIVPEPEMRRPPSPSSEAGSKNSPSSRSMSGRREAGTQAVSLSGLPDPNYYLARELDDYPRPLEPLRIDQPPGSSSGEVRLELLIDERGVVRDITFSGITEPGGMHEALRGALMATLFIPAIKNGRAVKSRVVLSVGLPVTSDR